MTKLISRLTGTCFIVLMSLSLSAQDKVMLCTGKSSHSYHKSSCTGLKQCRATVITVSLKDAIASGRDPCDFCYGHVPGQTVQSTRNVSSQQTGQSNPSATRLYDKRTNTSSQTNQCLATTKKGTRCSRSSSAGGYCWQHAK